MIFEEQQIPPSFDPGDFCARLWKAGRPVILVMGIVLLLAVVSGGVIFYRCAKALDRQLRSGPFHNGANIYTADICLAPGDKLSMTDVTRMLRLAGYQDSSSGMPGTFSASPQVLNIVPLPSTTLPRARITFGAKQPQILRVDVDGHAAKNWVVGHPLLANLSSGREKRHLVSFHEIPPVLIRAVVSAEDKRFFGHSGLDLRRLVKAAYVDLEAGRKEQGASTLTMQLVRGLWLQPEKRWTRKLTEIMMTIHLEGKWSKEQIFETYANQIYLGEDGPYSIHGFAQASQMFFGKELRQLTLPEAALLAGMIQRPSYFNPYRNPERAHDRRDLVLAMMRENRYIDDAQYQNAVESPLHLVGPAQTEDSSETAYILDRVHEELQKLGPEDSQVRNVYVTIDLNLQRAAREAVDTGMAEVDKLLARKYKKSGVRAEAALIALNPHTGEIKAMIGGRDYGRSQLNRLLAKRPPGSVFKPFVYAAALNTAVSGGSEILTPTTTVDDSPITFRDGGKTYQPANFHHEIFGTQTLRQALARSDNIAAVKVAQRVGLNSVVAMARRAGLNEQIAATPSVALGSYAVTPLEMAGAYTMFANGGTRVRPYVLEGLTNSNGESVQRQQGESERALDPRVAYLMVSMLQEVMRSGTAAGVRSRGFLLPAAGKTGTSHDGWFAGFTSELLCLVWVGFDDYQELELEGAKSALPIWAEFMKKASNFSAYRGAKEFAQPSGIGSAKICTQSGKLATDLCPASRNEVFIQGTEPQEQCDEHVTPSYSSTDALVVVESDAAFPK